MSAPQNALAPPIVLDTLQRKQRDLYAEMKRCEQHHKDYLLAEKYHQQVSDFLDSLRGPE